MDAKDKGNLCAALAALFSPPDDSAAEFSGPAASEKALRGDFERLLADRKKEYHRLFDDLRGARISLVESTYKPWTFDETCPLSIAGQKGLLMGDPALHMLEISRALGLEVPEDFRSTPDHLVLELELLSWLYRTGTESQARKFIADHLDWIPDLKRKIEDVDPRSFYREAAEKLDLFLQGEKESWKDKEDGPQSVY
jgi:TorA maturation chaperone TorD